MPRLMKMPEDIQRWVGGLESGGFRTRPETKSGQGLHAHPTLVSRVALCDHFKLPGPGSPPWPDGTGMLSACRAMKSP